MMTPCRAYWTLVALGLGLCALAAYVWWDTLNEAHRAAQRIAEESLLSHDKDVSRETEWDICVIPACYEFEVN